MGWKRALLTLGLAIFAVFLGIRARASAADAQRVLGFEATADWTAAGGTITGTSTKRTQGNTSLAVAAHGYTVLTSRSIGPLGAVSQQFLFDINLPTSQPNPSWFGAAQLFVSAPSIGLNNAYIGQRELTGLTPGQFTTLSFAVPADLRTKLSGTYFDLTFSVVLNVPTNATGTYLVDNLQVSAAIPSDSTVNNGDLAAILGFENSDDWTVAGGTSQGTSAATRSQGNFSLIVQAVGYTTITSKPLVSIAPINPTIKFDLELPTLQPNPNWFGAAQLYVSAPSLNLYNAYIGQRDLTGLPTGQFTTLSFDVPSNIQALLNSTTYSDLRFTIVLNVPAAGTGLYYVDNLDVGPVTEPPAAPTGPFRSDLVGTATTGAATLKIDDDTFHPPVVQMMTYVDSVDGNCVPSDTQLCRFDVPMQYVRLGAFSIKDTDVSRMVIRNSLPFEVTLGGSHGLSARVPSYVQFAGIMNTDIGELVLVPTSSNVNISINPGGDGLVALSGQLSGRADGHNFTVSFSISANTPLANRMPLPNAGPDQTVTATGCTTTVSLDGSATVDPDGNLVSFQWYRDMTMVGSGPTPSVLVRKNGLNVYTLIATDAYGGQAADEVTVDAHLGSGCP